MTAPRVGRRPLAGRVSPCCSSPGSAACSSVAATTPRSRRPRRSAGDEAATLEYVIPVGAGEALDAGTPLEILPAELEVNVGDTIRIENQDDRGHTVGPFFVGANETLTQRFSTPGEFEGVCTVHPSGQLILIVNA